MRMATNGVRLDLGAVRAMPCERPQDLRLVHGQNHPMAAEKYRLLAYRIRKKRLHRPVIKVLVTSAIPGEGKTATATNLALVLARNGKRVLLVDGDLRQPDVHKVLGITSQPGLGEFLSGEVELIEALRRVEPFGIFCLPAGRSTANPIPLLEQPALSGALSAVEEVFEWVIIDSPPINPFADAHCIASLVDGVVLVCRWNLTPREELEQALTTLKGMPLLGLVVNGYDEPRDAYYYSRYYRSE